MGQTESVHSRFVMVCRNSKTARNRDFRKVSTHFPFRTRCDTRVLVLGGVCINLRCDIATLKSIRPIVPVAMTNQIEDDEIEQSVTKTTEIEPDVGPGVVGDLLIGELDSWHVGICEVVKDDDDLLVCGENGHLVKRVNTDVWTTSVLSDTDVKDLDKIAGMINSAIESEYDEL